MKKELKEKLSKQTSYHYVQDVFEPTIDQQKKSVEELKKSLTTRSEKLTDTILEGLENEDEITQRDNEILTKLTNSNAVSASFVKILVYLLKSVRRPVLL